MNYQEFLNTKRLSARQYGFDYDPPGFLFPFQREIVRRALKIGRFSIFADCGLGKTPMQLEWGKAVSEYTGKPVLIFAPLAVAEQTRREGMKFGIPVTLAEKQEDIKPGVNVSNYEKIHHFTPDGLGGMVLDESGILKNYGGHYRKLLTDFAQSIDYRLCCTATPAPNDLIEIINHAEFLGVLSGKEAIALFFKTDGNTTHSWRIKKHAENDFWRWVASWAVAVRMPSDLGYNNGDFVLPKLNIIQHTVSGHISDGFLFQVEAHTMQERRQARKESLDSRVNICAELIRKTEKSLTLTGSECSIKECGKKNTQKTDAKNTSSLKVNDCGESLSADLLKKTKTICANTIIRINKNIPNTENATKNKEINQEETDILLTLSTGKNANSSLGLETKSQKETQGLLPSSEYRQKNMTPCCQDKMDVAPYVEVSTETQKKEDSTLTIATKQETCEAFCAQNATLGLENSRIESTCLLERQVTYREPWIIWCHLNSEQDLLAKLLGKDAFSIYGSLPSEEKKDRLIAWLDGERPYLISKPSIIGYGINMQHCYNMAFVGLSDSFEELYQGIRRCWRFGQKNTVNVNLVVADTEGAVLQNVQRKERDHSEMMAKIIDHMGQEYGRCKDDDRYTGKEKVEVPSWIAR